MIFTPEIIEKLGHYVYLYLDPDTDEIFYIGKGIGNRVFAHLSDSAESEKTRRIAAIRQRGREPRIELLRYGLSEHEAALVEASAIDLFGTEALTNKVRGTDSRSYGRVSIEDIVLTYSAETAVIAHPLILITINRLYRSHMTPLELYEATRGIWVIGRRHTAYACAVFQGIIREVYRIHQWHPAGTLAYFTRDNADFKGSGRWEFEGEVAYEIREQYLHQSVRAYLGTASQNPIRYVYPED